MPKNFESDNQGGLNIETLDRGVIESIVDRNEFDIEFHGQNIALILAGEEHHNLLDIKLQTTLIEGVQPEFVLHEFLSGWIYNPNTKEVRLQENRRAYPDLEQENLGLKSVDKLVLEAAKKVGAMIVGCDITFFELDMLERKIAKENPDSYEYSEGLLSRSNPDEIITPAHSLIMPYRDRRIRDTIFDYLALTRNPLIAIVGGAHSDNLTQGNMLNGKGFDYVKIGRKKR